MSLIDLESVTIFRAAGKVLDSVSMTITQGSRIGVVGHNGSGKSTLLAVAAGSLQPDSGTVRTKRGLRVATLDQQPDLGDGSVAEALGSSWEVQAVAQRLGIAHLLDRNITSLSGGEQRRLALAKTLVADVELLILDEPTNHLDIDAIDWLEERLAAYRGAILLVSHDRHLLDAVSSEVIEVDQGNLYRHQGGYRGYLEGRQSRKDASEAAEAVRRNLARREKEWLLRGAPARTRKPKAHKERALELQKSTLTTHIRDSALHLHSETPRLGSMVIEAENISVRIGDRTLIEGLTLRLGNDERLGVVGPNGTGKSCLLDVLAGKTEPASGTVKYGSTVSLGYLDQKGVTLDPTARVIDAFTHGRGNPDWRDKALLEQFWFEPATQYGPISDLSGGERRRLQLVLVLAQDPNVLILDEPTNDLDLDTLRSLEDFLDDWPGAVICVSHDRAFLERTMTEVIIVDESATASRVPGGFGSWLEQRRAKRQSGRAFTSGAARTKSQTSKSGSASGAKRGANASEGPSRSTLRHRLKEVDKSLKKATRRVEELSKELESVDDHAELSRIGELLAQAQSTCDTLEEDWLNISLELEES